MKAKKLLIFGAGSDMAPDIATTFYQWPVLLTHKQCDVANLQDVEEAILTHMPSIVVNLAGVSHVVQMDNPTEHYLEEIRTNLIGSFNIASVATKYITKATLIFVASVAGLYGKGNHAGYCASKAGVISLVQSLGMEGYNAYAVSPGRVDTKMREHDYPGEDKKTRLTTAQIAGVMKEIVDRKFKPGDNIIIRKKGYKTLRRIDRGEPWKTYLNVQPV